MIPKAEEGPCRTDLACSSVSHAHDGSRSPGTPKLMRIGKTDAKGGASDYGDKGAAGISTIGSLKVY